MAEEAMFRVPKVAYILGFTTEAALQRVFERRLWEAKELTR